MTPRAPWDAVIISQCDEKCCFRETCPSDRQAGLAALWRQGKITQPDQCWAFAHLAALHLETTGHQAPATVAEFKQQLAAHRAPPSA